jgi:hypothetical protein
MFPSNFWQRIDFGQVVPVICAPTLSAGVLECGGAPPLCDAANTPRTAQHFSVDPLFERCATSPIGHRRYSRNRSLCEWKDTINIKIHGGETKCPQEREWARSQGSRSTPRAPKEFEAAKIAKEDAGFTDR